MRVRGITTRKIREILRAESQLARGGNAGLRPNLRLRRDADIGVTLEAEPIAASRRRLPPIRIRAVNIAGLSRLRLSVLRSGTDGSTLVLIGDSSHCATGTDVPCSTPE